MWHSVRNSFPYKGIYEGWTGGRPLPIPPLSPSFLLGAHNFPLFPSLPFFSVLPPPALVALLRPLSSLPPPSPLPPAPIISPALLTCPPLMCACVRPSRFTLWTRYRLQFLPDHFQNFTCKLLMMRGTLLIIGHRVKRLPFLPNHFKLRMQVVDDERRNPIDFGSRGQRSTLALCIKPCGHDTDYSFCPITTKLQMHIADDDRRNPIDVRSRGQRSRSTLALCV